MNFYKEQNARIAVFYTTLSSPPPMSMLEFGNNQSDFLIRKTTFHYVKQLIYQLFNYSLLDKSICREFIPNIHECYTPDAV